MTSSQESSQKIFCSLPTEEKPATPENHTILLAFSRCALSSAEITPLVELHRLLHTTDWIPSDAGLRRALLEFFRDEDYSSFHDYNPTSPQAFEHDCLRFALVVEVMIISITKCDSLCIDDGALHKVLRGGAAVFGLFSKRFGEIGSRKVAAMDCAGGSDRFSPLSCLHHPDTPSESLREAITLKSYLALTITDLVRRLLRPADGRTEGHGPPTAPAAHPRSFLDASALEAHSLSQGTRPTDSRNLSSLSRVCLDSQFLIELLEESIGAPAESPAPPVLLETSTAVLERLTSCLHTRPAVLRSTFPLHELFHVVRLGLARAQEGFAQGDVEHAERVVQLLRTALNLANEPGSHEFMCTRLFCTILQGIFCRAEAASATAHGDEIVLIACIFCAFLRKMGGQPGKTTGLQWILTADKLHAAMGNVIHRDRHTESGGNQLRVAASYCALFFGSIAALGPSAVAASGGPTPRDILRRHCLTTDILLRTLHEFVQFQSQAGILALETLTAISSVIDEIVSRAEEGEWM